MSDELKPCAHCAKPGIEIEHRCGDFHEWSIECSGCYCRTDWYSLRDAAIFAWNTRADDAQIAANDNLPAENDISTDGHARNDTETMDSRERLEADALDYVVRTAKLCHGLGLRRELWQFNPEPLLMHIRQCLDRQAAITSRECETEFLDRAEVIITRRELKQRELQEQVDSLTAELCCGERKSREYAYNELNKMLALDGKRVKQINELTAERDELERANNRQARKITGVCSLNDAQSKRIKELEAERDELRDIIAHMPKTEAECEACQDAHDRLMFNAKMHQDELNEHWRKANDGWAEANAEAERWRQKCDELRDKLHEKQHVCDVQRDSFLKLETENAELRRALDGASDALESI